MENRMTELRDVTCYLGSHNVTCRRVARHKRTHPAWTPANKAGTWFTDPGLAGGRLVTWWYPGGESNLRSLWWNVQRHQDTKSYVVFAALIAKNVAVRNLPLSMHDYIIFGVHSAKICICSSFGFNVYTLTVQKQDEKTKVLSVTKTECQKSKKQNFPRFVPFSFIVQKHRWNL